MRGVMTLNDSFGIGKTFEEIVNEYSDMVTRICVVKLRNLENAKDCYQNVFLKLYAKQPAFESTDHMKAWLIRVAVRECIDYSRQFWLKKVVCMEEITALAAEPQKEVLEEVLEMPDKYREVVYLHYYEGYSVAGIARMLDRKEGAVKSQLSRARKLLRKELEGQGYGK
jgi:RNA polymerase sigma-70 factor (ECF subfamily)